MLIVTLDTGKMSNFLHGLSATIFFILMLIVVSIISYILTQLRKSRPNCISNFSYWFKMITLILQWVALITLVYSTYSFD